MPPRCRRRSQRDARQHDDRQGDIEHDHHRDGEIDGTQNGPRGIRHALSGIRHEPVARIIEKRQADAGDWPGQTWMHMVHLGMAELRSDDREHRQDNQLERDQQQFGPPNQVRRCQVEQVQQDHDARSEAIDDNMIGAGEAQRRGIGTERLSSTLSNHAAWASAFAARSHSSRGILMLSRRRQDMKET